MAVGILVAIVGGRPWWAGAILIVVGIVGTRHLRRSVRRVTALGHQPRAGQAAIADDQQPS